MNQTAIKQPVLSQTTATHASSSVARPKIMRRPAQFSQAAGEIILSDISLKAPSPTVADTASINPPASRTWQEDGRFAITLLAIVIGINLILSAWLSPTANTPSITHTPVATLKTPQQPVILNELNPPESNQ